MSNMSYCRFQNTVIDLRACLNAIQECDDLSKDEEQAKRTLIQLCKDIIEESEYQEDCEEDVDVDSSGSFSAGNWMNDDECPSFLI